MMIECEYENNNHEGKTISTSCSANSRYLHYYIYEFQELNFMGNYFVQLMRSVKLFEKALSPADSSLRSYDNLLVGTYLHYFMSQPIVEPYYDRKISRCFHLFSNSFLST